MHSTISRMRNNILKKSFCWKVILKLFRIKLWLLFPPLPKSSSRGQLVFDRCPCPCSMPQDTRRHHWSHVRAHLWENWRAQQNIFFLGTDLAGGWHLTQKRSSVTRPYYTPQHPHEWTVSYNRTRVSVILSLTIIQAGQYKAKLKL